MNKSERESIRQIYLDIYKKSWTYEKLTNKERNKIIHVLANCELYGNTKKQVCDQLRTIYDTFLSALDYKPIGWRENAEILF